MTILVESLKRLYSDEKIDIINVKKLLEENKISQEEYDYIVVENKN